MPGPYYVDPSKTGGANTGGSWTDAFLTLKQATDAAGTGETIYCTGSESVSTSVFYTCAVGVRIIATTDTSNAPPTSYTAGAYTCNANTAGVSINLYGGSYYGIYFVSGSGSTSSNINIAANDDRVVYCEDCKFTLNSTNSSSAITFGVSGTGINSAARLVNTEAHWGNAGQGFTFLGGGQVEWIGGIPVGTTSLTNMIEVSSGRGVAKARFEGCDLSTESGNLVAGSLAAPTLVEFSQCKLHASVVPLGSSPNRAGGDVLLFDCYTGTADTAIKNSSFAHYNYLGSTVLSTAVYASAGATHDGTNYGTSWLVSSTANASLAEPYVSPWIDIYNAGGSAITPKFEVVRSGSSTAYTTAEVWSEWLVKTTNDSSRSTFYGDRAGPVDAITTGQATGALGASDWTGENATAWFGKLECGSVTPQEIGHIRGRIVIGKASVTDLYVDPKIRTA